MERNTFQSLGDDRPEPGLARSVLFDAQGRLFVGDRGVRRWSSESGLWEPLGVDVVATEFTADFGGNLYAPGYMLPAQSTLWRLLPEPSMTHAPEADAQGALYAVNAKELLRLPAGGERWQKVELPGAPADMKLVSNPQRTRLYVRADLPDGGVYEVRAGAPSGTRYAGDALPVGFEADGTSYYFLADTLYRVTPEGTKTQVAQTRLEGLQLQTPFFRDQDGAFYATALNADASTKYGVKLAPGQTRWETLAPLGAVAHSIAVRDDGLVLEFDPRSEAAPSLKELYGTGQSSLLVDAKAEGVKFSPSRVDLLGADEALVGFTVHEATRAEGLSVSAPTDQGFTAQLTEVRRVPHGVAGVVRLRASADVKPGVYAATVTSAGGQSARVEVRVERPRLKASDMWQPTFEFNTWLVPRECFAIRQDGTVLRWQTLTTRPNTWRQPGVWGVRSLAMSQDKRMYAVRVDGSVWFWDVAEGAPAPRRVPGLPPIVALAANEFQVNVSALDDSGQVWWWSSRQVENPSQVPVRVPGLTDVVAVTSDLDALRADGRVWNFWGGTPVPVSGLAGVKTLRPSWAVRADGSAWMRGWEDKLRVQRNDEVFATAQTQLYRIYEPHYTWGTEAMRAVRSDGTLWDHTVNLPSWSYLQQQPILPRPNFQLRTPPDVQGVKLGIDSYSVISYMIVLGDGTLWMANGPSREPLRVEGVQGIRSFKPQPDFGVFGPDDTTAVRPGTTVDLPALVARTGGFTGPLEVTAPDLPPGVSLAPLTLAAGATSGTLTLTLAPDASFPEGTELPFVVSSGSQTRRSYVKLRTLTDP